MNEAPSVRAAGLPSRLALAAVGGDIVLLYSNLFIHILCVNPIGYVLY